jgi:hypothetical protein
MSRRCDILRKNKCSDNEKFFSYIINQYIFPKNRIFEKYKLRFAKEFYVNQRIHRIFTLFTSMFKTNLFIIQL